MAPGSVIDALTEDMPLPDRLALARALVPGFAIVPLEMTPEQARRSLAGHAVADRVRDANPAEYERMVAMRQATWRQLVAAMGEGE
jgi:hypothetical protein